MGEVYEHIGLLVTFFKTVVDWKGQTVVPTAADTGHHLKTVLIALSGHHLTHAPTGAHQYHLAHLHITS